MRYASILAIAIALLALAACGSGDQPAGDGNSGLNNPADEGGGGGGVPAEVVKTKEVTIDVTGMS